MQSISTSRIEFAANGDYAPGYLARPEGEGPFPGVIIIQEWWGLNRHIEEVTERVAQEGFVALSPDLYRGQVALEPDEARKLAMEMDRERAVVDIQGAVNYLITQAFVVPKQVGIVGFCMGGGLALWMASAGQNVGAVTVFYGGRGEVDDETARKISAPILGIYGEKDEGIPLDMVRRNEQKLREHGKTIEIMIYPDAPHAFFNDTRAAYRPEAAADAWQKMLTWFRRYLTT